MEILMNTIIMITFMICFFNSGHIFNNVYESLFNNLALNN